MIDSTGNNLVFLLSTPRAGSTLLSVMLGRHSRVFSPNEPWFLLPLLGMHQEQAGVLTAYDQKWASLAIRELLPTDEFREAARAFARQVYNRHLEKSGKTIFLDKTPRYYHILPELHDLFPSSKKVWLKRNPLDVAASFVSTWNLPLPELIGDRLTPSSFDLTLGPLRFSHFFKGQKDTFELAYEDLVAEPEQHLAELCSFIGVTTEPNLHHYSPETDHLETLRRTAMGDKKILGFTRPHSQSVGQWRKVLSRNEVQLLLNYLGAYPFERMGYGDTLFSLRKSGYTIPPPNEVQEKARALEERARVFPFSSGDQIAAVDDLPKLMRKLRRHWWLRLGRRLGVFRLSSV